MTRPQVPKVGPRKDVGIDVAKLEADDQEFLRGTAPSRYFEARLRLLLLAADPEFAGQAEGPLQHRAFGIPASNEPLFTDLFEAMESTNLFHHAAETLWRLFLCADDPLSFQLALARLNPPTLREHLRAWLELDTEDQAGRVRTVFLIEPDTDPVGGVRAAARLLTHCARTLLNDSPVYNATKHGLAARAERSQIGFAETGSPTTPKLFRAGLWVTSVQAEQRTDRQKWTLTRTAIDVPRTLVVTWWVIAMQQTVWDAARARRNVGDEKQLIGLPDPEQVRMVLDYERMDIARVQRDFAYDDSGQTITMEIDVLSSSPIVDYEDE